MQAAGRTMTASRAKSPASLPRAALVVVLGSLLLAPAPAPPTTEPVRALAERQPARGLLAYFAWRAAITDDGRAQKTRGLEALSRRAKSALVQAQASWDLARLRALAGDLDAARRLDRASGLVEEAWLLGPLPKEGALLADEALPFEQPFSSDATTEGLGREVGFQRVNARAWLGAFDLDSYLEPDDEIGAVVVVGVRSQRAQSAAVRVGSSAPVVVRMNGVEVARDLATRALRPDQTTAPVSLARGMNLLVVRTWSYGAGMELSLRLTTPDGAPLSGVSLTTDAAALASVTPAVAPRRDASDVVDVAAIVRGSAAAEDASLVALREAAALERGLSFADTRAPVLLEEQWLERAVAKAEVAGTVAAVDDALAADHLRLGELLVDRDPSAARLHLERVIDLGGDVAAAHVLLAGLLADIGLIDRARHEHEAARAAAPNDPDVLRARLAFERVHGHLRTAWTRRALALAERAPSVDNLEAVADVARELGDSGAALQHLARVAELEPANPSWVFARVDQLEQQLGDSDEPDVLISEIITLLRRRLALRPDAHHSARELAITLLGAGRRDEARALAAERVREFPGRLEPLRLVAEVRLLEGERDAAREALSKALALRPQHRQVGELYRALTQEGGGLAARYGVEAKTLPRSKPEGALEVGAHVAAHTVAIRFFDNGLGQVLTDRVIDVHDALKADGLRSMAIPYSAGREVVEVLRAERILPDGRTVPAREIVEHAPDGKQSGMYTDVNYKVVVFGDLAPGDRLHLRVLKHLVGQQNLFGDFFGHIEAIESTVPVERWRLVVEAPRTRTLSIGGRGVPEPNISEPADRPDVRVYDLVATHIPRLVAEPGMPPFFQVARYASVSTYQSWRALGDWYAELVREQLVLDEDLRELAHELVAGATDDEEKVRRVYEHVVTSTRYVGIELGIHGWKPFPVTEVYRRKYGDCKDKASLLVALLEEVGVEARLALVRTADNGLLAGEPASMWAFNHAIAYVPALDLFLDGTAERSGYRELPDMDQGAMSLIVKEPGSDEESRLVRIPLAGAQENLNTSSYVLRLTPEGGLEVEGEERFQGVQVAEQRRELFDEATRKEDLERTLSAVLPGTRVTSVKVTDLSLARAQVGYDFQASIPDRATTASDGSLVMPISLYPHGLARSYAERSQREQALWLSHPWRTRNVMRYRLPPGYVVVDLPKSQSVESEHLRFKQTITPTEDGFVVDEDTAILSRIIPESDYQEFRQAALAADAMMRRKVRLARRPR